LLCFGGVARVRGGIGRLLAGVRLAAGRLVDRRTDGRADFGVAVRGLDTVDFGLAVVALGLAVVALAWTVVEALTVLRLAVVRRLAAALGLAVVLPAAVVRVPVVLDFAAVLGLLVLGLVAEAVVLDLAVDFRAVDDLVAAGRRDVVAAGLAVDMVLAAAVSAFAAVVMDLVAVFMARIADDIVLADDVALVAAAVILVAADVTLVAADETVRAADAGVAPFLDEVLRVERDAVRRAPVPPVDRAAVLRVDREEVLRVERDAGFRVVDEAVPAGLAAMLRFAVGLARLTVPALVFGRLAVPDALRLTDLLRAVLAELRRLAARVVV
jgi:hypothetical protein